MVLPSGDELELITREVWSSFIDPDEGSLERRGPASADDLVTACVHLSGGYTGSVLLQCSPVAARLMAAQLFATGAEDLTSGDIDDAAGELVNVVGGNVKSILPGPSTLSLPVVVKGAHTRFATPWEQLVQRIDLVWRAEPLAVSLLQQTSEPERGHRPCGS